MLRLAAGGGAGSQRWQRRFWLRGVFALLLAVGLGAVGWALWMPAKAALGQQLLAAAYDRAKAAGAAGVSTRQTPWAWADMAPLAKLRFPSLNAERLVLDQATGEAMAWGPGWIRGSAPLGAPGLSAVAAHRDTHFALLQHLSEGDEIDLETASGETGRYRVVETRVVDSRRWRLPLIERGPDMLALSTCYPFESVQEGPLRYLVFAARIDDPADASSARAPIRGPEASGS